MSAIERAYLQEAADYEIERDEANFRFSINMESRSSPDKYEKT